MGVAHGRRLTPVDGKLKYVEARTLVGDGLQKAQKARDRHLADIRYAIDYHLTTVAYKDVPCGKCRLPLGAAGFAEALPDFEPPAIQCTTCLGRGVVRRRRTDATSLANAKLVTYWNSVLDDLVRCAKIKACSSGADQAYIELETANRTLLIKFGNEKQTSLEGADAEQGVRRGIIDAAVRFDPTKQKDGRYCCAAFATVAYNWCRRNSRARHTGWKRAGVYAPSIEAMGTDEEGNGAAAMITSAEGALGTFSAPATAPTSLILDMREQVEALPEMQRAVVQAELGGLSTGEISKKLDISRAKVRSLRALAFEVLRDSLGGYVSTLHD